eukprot:TRINITY_DN5093_c0_g1_i6.p1 TRINITY_DN5093_c0_g1~~TRINITY_DN5093_c0_g1_i6.p1  ORF type:complete len:751 (+),score=55.26 TRINITY_DN5093_c0_g1_i6:150-2402(+)
MGTYNKPFQLLLLMITSGTFVSGQFGTIQEELSTASLLSRSVKGITQEVADILDFGANLGRKNFPLDAYDFAVRISQRQIAQFEAVPVPLSSSEKTSLQSIVNDCQVNPAKASSDFVSVKNGKFSYKNEDYTFLGFNAYQTVLQAMSQPNYIDNLFSRAQGLGLKVARIWLFSHEIRTGPLQWDDSVFQAIDKIIQKAANYDIKIVFAFANYWEHFIGSEQYVFWAEGTLQNKTIQDFFQGENSKLLYKAHVCKAINRINSKTGIRWRDDPTIMGWNLMNEPRCPGCISGGSRSSVTNQWIDEMAGFIKSIDPNHLVTSGMEGFSTDESGSGNKDNPGAWALCQGTDFVKGHSSRNIDYATVHIYPEHKVWDYDNNIFCDVACQIDWAQQYYEARLTVATSTLKKPLVIEEFGMSLKIKLRISQPDGGYVERLYTRTERVDIYKRLTGSMLSAIERGEYVGGFMFWMAVTDNYPDYDGFTIELDEGISFEGQPPPSYNILQTFRKQEDEKRCTESKSAWRPNPINPLPLPINVGGNFVVQVLANTARLLNQTLSNGGECVDITPDSTYTCQQQNDFGKCFESWMLAGDYCKKTCGRCADTQVSDCDDIPPNSQFSCEQQREFGKCDEDWMTSGDYCRRTCNSCIEDVSPVDSASPSPTPTPSPNPVQDCEEVTPSGGFSCSEQQGWGKCEADWMLAGGYCDITCGRCVPSGCDDVAPDNVYSCQQQSDFGKCNESWMLNGNFCAQTCGRC